MKLSEFYEYKNQLMEDLLTSERIVELLSDPDSVGSAIGLEDAHELVYKQVFPYEYVPETVQDGKTFICCDVDIQAAYNNSKNGKTFYEPILYIWVFAHRSALRLPEGGVRTDELCAEICNKIDGSFKYGLGELILNAAKRFAPMTDYQGKVLVFKAKDWNRQFDPNKEIPSNRKRG